MLINPQQIVYIKEIDSKPCKEFTYRKPSNILFGHIGYSEAIISREGEKFDLELFEKLYPQILIVRKGEEVTLKYKYETQLYFSNGKRVSRWFTLKSEQDKFSKQFTQLVSI